MSTVENLPGACLEDARPAPEPLPDTPRGDVLSVMIDCPTLRAEIWVIEDSASPPCDGRAVYRRAELRALAEKPPETLWLIQVVKLTFPGCRVIR